MTLLTPLGLLGLIGIIVLIIIYIIKPNFQQKFISSTYVWKLSLKYRKKKIPTNKLRNLLLILCQVLFLATCAAILARPNLIIQSAIKEPEVVIIFDASASMRANLDGEKRFVRAVEDASELIEETFEEDGYVSLIFADDEPTYMLSQRMRQDSFINFVDVCKTVIRDREDPIIFLLGNTIDRNHQWFYEMELNDIVNSLPLGAHTETLTHDGTAIYLDFFSPGQTPQKTKHNRLFFGFKNKKLGAITGKDWSLTVMPHPPIDDTREIITRRFYLLYEDRLLNLELCRSESDGTHVIAHMATKGPYNDSIIFTLGLRLDWRYRYKFGHTKADKLIWTLYERKQFYFASNAVGAIVEKYYQAAKDYRRLY